MQSVHSWFYLDIGELNHQYLWQQRIVTLWFFCVFPRKFVIFNDELTITMVGADDQEQLDASSWKLGLLCGSKVENISESWVQYVHSSHSAIQSSPCGQTERCFLLTTFLVTRPLAGKTTLQVHMTDFLASKLEMDFGISSVIYIPESCTFSKWPTSMT